MTKSRSPFSPSEASPARIRLARERAGLTKAVLAGRLGLTVRACSALEDGSSRGPDVEALAEALGVTPEFLLRNEGEAIEVEEARFRASSRATLRQRTAACAAGVTGIEFYSWLASRFRLRDVVLPDLDGETPERAAEAVRALWGQGRGALPNLLQLSEAHGVRVMSLPSIAQTVDAFSLWRDGEPYVFLSTMKTAERSRFDLAHEIGHLVMHSRGHQGDLEAEADAFAAFFLMPADLLLARVGRELALPAVLRLRSQYGVAALAMLRRLHDLGRLSDTAYRMDCVALAQRGFRSGEEGGLPREHSQVFRQTFDALRSQGVTVEQAAHEVGLSASDLHDLTFGQFVAPMGTRGDAVRTSARATLRAV